MTALRTVLPVVVAILGGGHMAHAQTALPTDFLCGAEATKKGLHAAHPKRRAYIAECIATKNAAKPTAPAPVPSGSTAKPVAPPVSPSPGVRAPIDSAEQRRGRIAFNCGALASKQGLHGGHPRRKAFVDDCIRRAPPVKD